MEATMQTVTSPQQQVAGTQATLLMRISLAIMILITMHLMMIFTAAIPTMTKLKITCIFKKNCKRLIKMRVYGDGESM